ncbi:MAG: murein L,D-transpeptidase [Phycisphaerae bacterium]|nr:murein L,D-transpeptidase [Phycisphaerae bacterium]
MRASHCPITGSPQTVAGILALAIVLTANLQRAAAQITDELRSAVALQLALEKTGLSPGLIDGLPGPKTTLGISEFQRVRGRRATGRLDAETRGLLRIDEANALVQYTITAADRAAIGPAPTDWNARARLDRLAYPSLAELIAERFHCHRRLLAKLNPGKSLDALSVGDRLVVPNAAEVIPTGMAGRLEVNLADKIIRAISTDGQLMALFHCSIPAQKDKHPSGNAHVEVVAANPTYTFNPRMWPEVKNVNRILEIPPGPRNPVGVRWIGLSLPGVGMHGTPTPEMIGKTGSHGCIRLTNWDAVRLAKMVRPGTPVRFSNSATALAEAH